MPALPDSLTIGELAARSGVTTSALRFCEQRGLLASQRIPPARARASTRRG
jgi:MerR family redox-sensitive transcriptional activator SoxR